MTAAADPRFPTFSPTIFLFFFFVLVPDSFCYLARTVNHTRMRLLAQALRAGIPSLAVLAPILLFSLPQASALVVPRGDINATLIPTTCLSTCQPTLDVQTKCGTDLKCRCTNASGNSLAQCLDCVVNATMGTVTGTLAQNAAEDVLSDYVNECAKQDAPISSLTLSLPTPTATAKPNDALIQAPHLVVTGIAALQVVFIVFGATL
ncbi:hypothetical protein B0H19DRAFT_1129848 [Mycena capillaripes]|nr:hypothetical protein B0H19DRAFT_1129848 [Mycena capillaripes]